MGRGITVSFTTANVVASGGTLGHHKTGIPNNVNILKIKIVPSTGSGASTIEVFQKDTLSATDLVAKWKAVSGNVYDPMDYSSGTPVEMPATDFLFAYDDEDLTGEFHMKFTNNDSVDKTYTVDVTYEEALVFDSSHNVAFPANVSVAGTLAVTGHVTLEGVTSTGATGTGKLVYDGSPTLVTPNIGAATGVSLNVSGAVVAGAASSIADFLVIPSGNKAVILGNSASTGAWLRNSGTDEISVQNHDNSALGKLQVLDITVTGNYLGNVPSHGISIQYLDWSSNPQTLSF